MAVLSLVSTQHPFIPDERNLPRGPVVSSLIRNPAPSSRHPATRSLVPTQIAQDSHPTRHSETVQNRSGAIGMECVLRLEGFSLRAALLCGAGFVWVAWRLEQLGRASLSLHRESLRDRGAVSRAKASPPCRVQRISAGISGSSTSILLVLAENGTECTYAKVHAL